MSAEEADSIRENTHAQVRNPMIGTFRVTARELLDFAMERGIVPVGSPAVALFDAVAPIDEAKGTHVAFCRFNGARGEGLLSSTGAGALFITSDMADAAQRLRPALYLPCDFPRLDFSLLLKKFWREPDWNRGTGANPDVHPTARIAPDVRVGPFSTIGAGVRIGPGSQISSGARIEFSEIGSNCWIGPNVVIGGPGFGYEDDDETGAVIEFPHVGSVRIGDRVRIGATCCIDRAALGWTIIEDDTKLDNNVHIGHNSRIGKRCKLTAGVTISGSVTVGDDCWFAPNSVIRDWRSVGNRALIGLGAAITRDVPDDATMFGNPARSIPRPKDRYR